MTLPQLSTQNAARSWKSSLIGAILAGLVATYVVVDAIDPKTIFTTIYIVLLIIKCLFVFAIATFGALVKDSNVTGDPPREVQSDSTNSSTENK